MEPEGKIQMRINVWINDEWITQMNDLDTDSYDGLIKLLSYIGDDTKTMSYDFETGEKLEPVIYEKCTCGLPIEIWDETFKKKLYVHWKCKCGAEYDIEYPLHLRD